MHIIISGAGGFLGRNLAKGFLAQGHRVTALVFREEDQKRLSECGAEVLVCPMCCYASLKEELRKSGRADSFFHFAWSKTAGRERGNVRSQMENVIYTADAAALAKAAGCRTFLFAASIMEYEAVNYLPLEDAQPHRGYIYSTAKLAADYIAKITVQDMGMKYVRLVISNIYGPDESSGRFLNTLIRRMCRNESIDLTPGDQPYDFIYITDAVCAMMQIAEHGKKHTYYIGNVSQRPLKEYIEMARAVVNPKARLNYGAIPYLGPVDAYQGVDTKSLEEFGFVAGVDFKSGIRSLLQSMDIGENDEISDSSGWK